MNQLLKKIKDMREEKGKEHETIALINEEISKSNDPSLTAELYWEAALNWQHIVMNIRTDNGGYEGVIDEATKEMAAAAQKAHEIITQNNIESMLSTSYRFLGRVADYNENYEQAKEYYEKGLEIIEDKDDKTESLELRGFITFDLIMMGHAQKGIDEAKKLFADYTDSNIGKTLKSEDYVKWAIWISGIFPRVILALNEREFNDFNKEELRSYLERSEKYLTEPEGEITWGGPDPFKYRKGEHKKALEVLANLLVGIFVLTPILF